MPDCEPASLFRVVLAFPGVTCLLAVTSLVTSCTGEDPVGGDGLSSGGATMGKGGATVIVPSTGGSGGAVGTGGGATVTSGGASSGCTIMPNEEGCAGLAFEGENVPLDIYIMFDQSGSMCSCIEPEGGQLCPDPRCASTRLDAIRSATSAFLADPESGGIGVGIGYFGKQPIGQASCSASDYSSPSVEIGLLPGHAAAIGASLAEVQPTGETPTASAIRGACEHVRDYRAANPGRKVVILLLTDGKPEAPVTCQNGSGPCCPILEDAALAASECYDGGLGSETYVLGVGPLLQNLDHIAAAGGTERAYLVEGGDVSTEVLDALNQIRSNAIPCQLELPPPPTGEELALDRVNVTYADAACSATQFSYVGDASGCREAGGWHYDDPQAPSTIVLCDTSCDRVSTPGGRLLFTVGCARQDDVPR